MRIQFTQNEKAVVFLTKDQLFSIQDALEFATINLKNNEKSEYLDVFKVEEEIRSEIKKAKAEKDLI